MCCGFCTRTFGSTCAVDCVWLRSSSQSNMEWKWKYGQQNKLHSKVCPTNEVRRPIGARQVAAETINHIIGTPRPYLCARSNALGDNTLFNSIICVLIKPEVGAAHTKSTERQGRSTSARTTFWERSIRIVPNKPNRTPHTTQHNRIELSIANNGRRAESSAGFIGAQISVLSSV